MMVMMNGVCGDEWITERVGVSLSLSSLSLYPEVREECTK